MSDRANRIGQAITVGLLVILYLAVIAWLCYYAMNTLESEVGKWLALLFIVGLGILYPGYKALLWLGAHLDDENEDDEEKN